MKKQLLGLVIALTTGFTSLVQAQNYYGFSQSNYSGVTGADVNPAFLADNRMAVDITLLGYSGGGYNNHLYFNPHQMPYWWTGTFRTDESGNYKDAAAQNYATSSDWGKIISSDSTSYYMNNNQGILFEYANAAGTGRTAYYNHQVDILNFMVSINDKMGFSFGVQNRTFLNVDHVSSELLKLAQNGLDYPDLHNINLEDQLLNISFNSWNEYQLGFGMVLLDNEEHFIKGGINLKLLQGLASFYMYTDEVDYNFYNADTANALNGHFNYGYSSNLETMVDGTFDYTTISSAESWGFGVDLGFVYEWRPDWKDYKYDMDGETNLWRKDENKYKLRVSFSINDIGGMSYTKGGDSRDFTVHINSLFDLAEFEDTDGLSTFNQNVDSLVQDELADYNSDDLKYFMNLPTNINYGIDYHVFNDFYVNVGGYIGFKMSKNANKVSYPSSIALTPRYDYKWAGISVPVSYTSTVGFRTGLSLRMGPIIIGTTDLKPILFMSNNDKKINGANIYASVKIPILKTHPKDDDMDKVSNKLDLCPDTPGVWEFKGCPDTDGDGIQDSEDACPSEAGLAEFNGCPDRDGDKVMDSKDNCPDTPGLVEFDGCPDTDGDKIIDKDDDCPDVAGIAAFNGCPDTDGDGIKDSDDLCPDVAGPKENDGCPDTDNDGIFDYLDECPTEAGPSENHGCPWPDTDGDGLLDKDDKCPYNAGPPANQGCPYVDTDGDGVLDKDDECVNVPGTVENNGCPEILEEEQEILNTAFDNLEFETGKAIIKQSSYESLEELAELLLKKEDWKLKVAGHTDNQGAAQSNLVLSKKRAEAVKAFLVQRGISEDRIIVQYFGEEKPIADNNTAEGRQKNRRVEMEVIFE